MEEVPPDELLKKKKASFMLFYTLVYYDTIVVYVRLHNLYCGKVWKAYNNCVVFENDGIFVTPCVDIRNLKVHGLLCWCS